MTAYTIHLLANYDPTPSGFNRLGATSHSEAADDIHLDPQDTKFIYAYKNLRFGWELANKLAKHRLPIPESLGVGEEWLFRACLNRKDPVKYRDRAISGAMFLASTEMRRDREVINALLVSKDTTPTEVAKYFNLDADTVCAYEQLFFNIYDRKNDAAFIRSVIYPDGRLVELMQNYVQNESLGKLLMRAGYNNGADEVLYFAGFQNDALKKISGAETPSKLESAFMAHAYLMVRNGYINQNLPAVTSAKSLIAAAKQGGDTGNNESPFHGAVGRLLYNEVLASKKKEAMTSLSRSS